MSRSREDWVEMAWTALGEGGVEAVRVERLARRLGVTKGSFYWHFRDRQELIDALLDRWFGLRKQDHVVPPGENLDPAERIWRVFERAITRGTRGQAASLRFWAQRHPNVAERIAEEDAKRFDFFVEQFMELCFPREEAEMRAQVYMGMITAEFVRTGGMAPEDRLHQARSHHGWLIGVGSGAAR